MDKNELRKFYIKKRNALTSKELETKSDIVAKKLFSTKQYQNSKTIFTYININSEFVTKDIIKKAWADNKKVAVPVMTDKKHEMVFITLTNFDELNENKYGILEPTLLSDKIAVSNIDTCIITPALCFDNSKYRLGYGGGYYDKYLSENKSLSNICLGFDFQLCDYVPRESNDIALDIIITENHMIL